MSSFYRIAYRIGFTPWEHAATHAVAAAQIAASFDREEQERRRPLGRALDVGCGRGHWSIVLAERGWNVTGIDVVPRAVRAARRRADGAGVTVRFVHGDATRMRQADVGSSFAFVWDFGTVHGLGDAQRHAVGREIDAVTTLDATILMLAWAPGRRGPLPRGMSRSDLEHMLPGWAVVGDVPFDASGLPPPLRRVDPHMYRLRRENG